MDDQIFKVNEQMEPLDGQETDPMISDIFRSRANTQAESEVSRISAASRRSHVPRLQRTLTSTASNDFSSKTWFSKAAQDDLEYFRRLWEYAKHNSSLLYEIKNSWMDNKSLLHIAVQLKYVKLGMLLVDNFRFGKIFKNNQSCSGFYGRNEPYSE